MGENACRERPKRLARARLVWKQIWIQNQHHLELVRSAINNPPENAGLGIYALTAPPGDSDPEG